MKYKNRHVLISGASGGIGFALAKNLLRKGARVTNFDVKKPDRKLKGLKTFNVDITNGKEISKALSGLDSPIDILVCNAGVMRRGNLIDSSEKDFDLLFDVNVKGTWLILKNSIKYLSPDALVVFMASRYSLKPRTDPALYGLTKMTQYQLGLLAKKTISGIIFKFVLPGPVNTPLALFGISGRALSKKKKLMQSPDYLASRIIQLFSSGKSHLVYDEKTGKYRMK